MSTPKRTRRFFIHSAHRHVGVSGVDAWNERASEAGFRQMQRPIRVCVVSGSEDDPWDDVAAVVAECFSEDSRVVCSTWEHVEASGDSLDCDCLVLLGSPTIADPARLQQLERYCRRSGSVVAIHDAAKIFPNWPTFAVDVLGCTGRPQQCVSRLDIEPVQGDPSKAVLVGVEPFVSRGDPLWDAQLTDDTTVLLWGHNSIVSTPVAWARQTWAGRVVCTSLGSHDDFRKPSFLRLLVNAIRWAAGH